MSTINTNKYLEQAKVIILDYLGDQKAKIYLFGSRANGTASRASDIDVAFLKTQPIKPIIIANLREALEESTIPYEVDLVDLDDVEAQFK